MPWPWQICFLVKVKSLKAVIFIERKKQMWILRVSNCFEDFLSSFLRGGVGGGGVRGKGVSSITSPLGESALKLVRSAICQLVVCVCVCAQWKGPAALCLLHGRGARQHTRGPPSLSLAQFGPYITITHTTRPISVARHLHCARQR